MEAPCAAVEGVVRGALACVAGLTHAAVACCASHHAHRAALLWRALAWVREAALLLAAVPSLLLAPCLMCCCVYRDFDADRDEWELGALPTVLGRVDMRRFFVVAFGQGAGAANVDDARLHERSLDSLGSGMIQPPYRLLRVRPADIEPLAQEAAVAALEEGGRRGGRRGAAAAAAAAEAEDDAFDGERARRKAMAAAAGASDDDSGSDDEAPEDGDAHVRHLEVEMPAAGAVAARHARDLRSVL